MRNTLRSTTAIRSIRQLSALPTIQRSSSWRRSTTPRTRASANSRIDSSESSTEAQK
jgi:hypothetical protein